MTLTLMLEEPSIVANMENSGIGPVTSAEVSKAMRQHAPRLKPLEWREIRIPNGNVYKTKDLLTKQSIWRHSKEDCDKYEADYERRVRELFE